MLKSRTVQSTQCLQCVTVSIDVHLCAWSKSVSARDAASAWPWLSPGQHGLQPAYPVSPEACFGEHLGSFGVLQWELGAWMPTGEITLAGSTAIDGMWLAQTGPQLFSFRLKYCIGSVWQQPYRLCSCEQGGCLLPPHLLRAESLSKPSHAFTCGQHGLILPVAAST